MFEALTLSQYRYLTAAVLAGVLVLLVFGWFAWRRYNSPAAKERRRRSFVNTQGRLTDGMVTDFNILEDGDSKGLIHYTYRIGGVEYSAAQDVSDLVDNLKDSATHIIGSVNVKYHTRNPFNSIVICEGWSGLRGTRKSKGTA